MSSWDMILSILSFRLELARLSCCSPGFFLPARLWPQASPDSFRRLRFSLFAGLLEVVKQTLNRLYARVRCLPTLDLGNGVEWHTADLRDFFKITQATPIQVGHEC